MADPRTHLYANNATCRLGEDLTAGETSIQIETGRGALFPDPDPGEIFILTLQDLVSGAMEIMYCTARTNDVCTVERGQEGTDAIEWVNSSNVILQNRITAGTLEHLEETTGGGGLAPVIIQLACSDLTTDLLAGNNKAYIRAAQAFTLTGVRASLLTASGGGNVSVDINKNGTPILYSPLIIDPGEKTSVTSSTTVIIDDDEIALDDEITIDLVDDGTGAKGLIVTLIGVPS